MLPKLPKDIMSRSRSTQIQWLIVGLIWATGLVFIVGSGFAYIMENLGVVYLAPGEVLVSSVIAIMMLAIYRWVKMKKTLNAIKDLPLEDLQNIAKEVLSEMESTPSKTIKNGEAYEKKIPVNFTGKTRVVTIRIIPGEKLSEEEIETAIDEVLMKHLTGLVIEASVSRKSQEDDEG